jgi:hypothetical protein
MGLKQELDRELEWFPPSELWAEIESRATRPGPTELPAHDGGPGGLPRKRLVAAVVAFVVFLGALAFLWSAFRAAPPRPAATPPAYLHQPGDIALSSGELIDPTTGRSTGSLPIRDATDISWSPDGSSLVYAAPDGVFVLVVDTHDTRQLVPCGSDRHACTVAWSPTGDEIAVAHDEVVEVVSVDGGRETPVRSIPRGDLVRDPSWSPDGEQLAFTVIGPSGTPRALYTVARDGMILRRSSKALRTLSALGRRRGRPTGRGSPTSIRTRGMAIGDGSSTSQSSTRTEQTQRC